MFALEVTSTCNYCFHLQTYHCTNIPFLWVITRTFVIWFRRNAAETICPSHSFSFRRPVEKATGRQLRITWSCLKWIKVICNFCAVKVRRTDYSSLLRKQLRRGLSGWCFTCNQLGMWQEAGVPSSSDQQQQANCVKNLALLQRLHLTGMLLNFWKTSSGASCDVSVRSWRPGDGTHPPSSGTEKSPS